LGFGDQSFKKLKYRFIMREKLLLLIAILATCLSMYAGTNMCVKLDDGQIVKYDVEEVLEVYSHFRCEKCEHFHTFRT